MIYITRQEHFNAAHRLFKPELTDEQNLEIFGKCSNPNWHGHNYSLFVTIKGEVNPETGFLINLKTLSKIINEKIIDKVDHKNFNLEVEFMKVFYLQQKISLCRYGNQLEGTIIDHGAELHCIKLYETERNFVEYYGS
jgi:6-pyruvoyltetrahydropterin/6-carboxytetrahydropterin synthase